MTIKIDINPRTPFDYQLAMDRLQGYVAPRDKLARLCESGQIVRIKQGLYVPGEGQIDPLGLASLIYGPSCISLETALSMHGLIPEAVEEITCVSIKRSKTFETPIGRFSYQPVNEAVFPIGINLRQTSGGAFFIAEPEKALCDRIARERKLSAQRDIPCFLFESLRIEPEALAAFRLPLVGELATGYRRASVTAFYKWLAKQRRGRREA